jgi:hypothetical protein
MMSLFRDLMGFPIDAFDMRALSPEEIQKYQMANLCAQQQAAVPDWTYWRQLAQYQPVDPRPLDERFADFKRRLAAAIEKRGGLPRSP